MIEIVIKLSTPFDSTPILDTLGNQTDDVLGAFVGLIGASLK